MHTPSLPGLESLSDIGMNGRVDMRPTLLRVLTDLYVQKMTHSAEEERHYTELALRLLETVDVPTRAAVAARLARHLSPPPRVIQKLAVDLPDVTAALRSQPRFERPVARPATAGGFPAKPHDEAALQPAARAVRGGSKTVAAAYVSIGSDLAGELSDMFFAADADERRLILLNLHIVASDAAGRRAIARDPALGRRLEAAALGRKREDFSRELAGLLGISRRLAQRIASDELGEPIVVAAKALSIPRDVLYRLLLFVNTAVGHSVERVHALAALHDAMTAQAANDVVAIWQALGTASDERAAPAPPPLSADRQGARPNPAAAARREPAPWPKQQRREAS
jgi:hypothetical protein